MNRFRAGLAPRCIAVVTLVASALTSGCAGTVTGGGGGSTPPPGALSVAMSVASASVQVGTAQAFTAMVANDTASKGVTWTLSGAGCSGATCGTVAPASSASGTPVTYTAPGSLPSPATVMLTATAVADPTKSASTTITLTTTPVPVGVTLSLATANVVVNGTQAFTATVTGDTAGKGVTWTVTGSGCTGAACGTVTPTSSASGVAVSYKAPAAVPSPATVTLKATSVADTTKSASATITVTAAAAPISVTLSLTAAQVTVNGTQAFTATVTNDSANKGVTWTVTGSGCTGAACGTVTPTSSASGAAVSYKAPAAVPNPATVTLKATSVADTTKSASATITVTAAAAPISVTLSPTSASVVVNGTRAFSATVANDAGNKGVTWTVTGAGCSGATCGTVSPTTSASGSAVTYTAPGSVPSPATVTLKATSVSDGTKSASATITVTAASGGTVAVTLTPKRGGIVVSQAQNFTATVTNDTGNQGVTWSVTGTGTLSAQTASTAKLTGTAAGSAVVTATSKADSTKSASVTIGVTDLAGVLSYHNNLSRDGVNSQEYALTTSNVNTSSFGKLFSCAADGTIYAQPLWVPMVNIGGGVHNVIVAVTMRDSVYVFDADASPCVTYWHKTLIPAGETYVNYNDVATADIYPDIGILGTPAIDPATKTIYLVTKTKTTGGTQHQRLHALNLSTSAEVSGAPIELDSTITSSGNCEGGGTMAFNPATQNQRPGLALVNGVVYIAWASHGDEGVYHGWVVGYNTSNLSRAGTLNVSINSIPGVGYCRGGIWMSGGAPAADTDANNVTSLYLITGNGAFDGSGSYGNSYLKLHTPTLGVTDFFTPHDQSSLDQNDQDVGSSGTALLINAASGKKLLVGGSKAEVIFVLDRNNMGGFNGTDNVVQEFAVTSHSFSTPAFWNNTLYYFGAQFSGQQAGQAYLFNPATGLFNTTPSAQTSSTLGFPGSSPSISATPSNTNGIVWAIDSSQRGTNNTAVANHTTIAAGPAVLHAYNATNIATELWNSSQAAGGRDTAGNAVKFVVPTVANGKVYVGTRGDDDTTGNGTRFGEVTVYGLLPN